MPPTEALSRDDYTVGWVTALPLELAAATAMLDEEHKRPSNFRQPSTDHNTYTWGCIEKHNVVLASLPAGVYGTVSAATVASSLLSSFPHLQVGLMVGIGAGIPRPGYDIRLGDVVVSNPQGQAGGVIQYDLGKRLAGGRFERKGSLNMPPEVLLTALATLQARHERQPSNVPQILEQMLRNNPFMAEPQDERPGYGYQGEENDRLFAPDYQHVGGLTCEGCDRDKELERKKRKSSAPRIHYGIIASGNTLVKDSSTRDSIIEGLDEDCICFEMEAAGLMNSFPCLVIRGICDYADSHKNDRWQRCAAAAAAAYAKELLSVVPEVSFPSPRRTNKRLTDEAKQSLILKALKFDVMDERFHGVSQEAKDTFGWIFNDDDAEERNPLFKSWLTLGSGIFHICGKLGSGKSTLMKYIWRNTQTAESLQLWAQERQKQLVTAQFFFWKPGSRRQKSFAGLVRSLLAQILRKYPKMIDTLFSSNLNSTTAPLHGDAFDITINDDEAMGAFNQLIQDDAIRSTHCFCFFIDGLDEFEEKDRSYTSLVLALNEWVSKDFVKLCVSSRELNVFESSLSVSREIRLQAFTHRDIEAFVNRTLNEQIHFQWLMKKDSASCKWLLRSVIGRAEGVFLWVVLTLNLLSEGLENRYSIDDLLGILRDIPEDLKGLFQRVLDTIPKSQKQKSLCALSITAKLYELRVSQFPLLMASFLNDYFQDPAFAEKGEFVEMCDQEVEERLVESKAQWIGRCKGLIEVRHNYIFASLTERDLLEFTHRSIADYLQEYGSHLEAEEIVNPFMQSCLAIVKTAPFSNKRLFYQDCAMEIKKLLLFLISYPQAIQLRYFPVLQQTDTALHEKESATFTKSRFQHSPPKSKPYENFYISFQEIACEVGFHEYLQWKFESTPSSHQVNETERKRDLSLAVHSISWHKDLTRTKETLRVLFQQGYSPNPSLNCDDRWKDIYPYCPWFEILDPVRLKPGVSGTWTWVEVFLESGAYHPKWYNISTDSEILIFIATCDGKYYHAARNYGRREKKEYLESLPPSLRQCPGMADLKDWVEFVKPENADAILELLKKPSYHPVQRSHGPEEPLTNKEHDSPDPPSAAE